ncbi:hypothetical protein QJQ45_017491 [Haematococcus lacustris]|nr:hypothetical protein QJQ45_017491 [Haematococcus lacustris]
MCVTDTKILSICCCLALLLFMARKKRRTGVGGPRAVPEDPDFDIVDRDEAEQPELTEAQRRRKASGEARAARVRDNTFHTRKAKLAHLTGHLPQALWDAFLERAVRPRVKAISERGVIGSLLLGFLVRGLFTLHVADQLDAQGQPLSYTDTDTCANATNAIEIGALCSEYLHEDYQPHVGTSLCATVSCYMWLQVNKQAKKLWPDHILTLAYGAAGFSGSGTIGCRGVPVSQMLKEAVKQFRPGRVVLVDEFRTSRVSSADNTPSETLLDTPPESFRWLRPVKSMAKRSQVRGLMCSTSINNITRFYDRDVSAALNIRRCAVGPGPRPTELCYWTNRPAMPKPGQPGQDWVNKQAKKLWPDHILTLAYGAAGFKGSGSIGCRGVPVSQMLKEAVKQFRPGRVVLVDEFRTSRVSSADNTPSETLLDTPPESFRFYDRDVSAALNIRRCAVGPGPPYLSQKQARSMLASWLLPEALGLHAAQETALYGTWSWPGAHTSTCPYPPAWKQTLLAQFPNQALTCIPIRQGERVAGAVTLVTEPSSKYRADPGLVMATGPFQEVAEVLQRREPELAVSLLSASHGQVRGALRNMASGVAAALCLRVVLITLCAACLRLRSRLLLVALLRCCPPEAVPLLAALLPWHLMLAQGDVAGLMAVLAHHLTKAAALCAPPGPQCCLALLGSPGPPGTPAAALLFGPPTPTHPTQQAGPEQVSCAI